MADTEVVRAQFGLRVRQLRRERGVSQEAFAHRIGLNRSYFGSVERGERNVSLDNIAKIAEGLGVPPLELLRFDALDELALTSPREEAPPKGGGRSTAAGGSDKPRRGKVGRGRAP